ncbi:MAG: GNAT family N-acetyltransferase [Anaerolineae bacterium]
MLPEGYTVRRATIDDLNAVVALRQEQELADWGTTYTTANDLRTQWERTHLNVDTWIVADAAGQVVAHAQIHTPDTATPQLYGVVRRDHQRHGIGRYLLALAEARAKAATRSLAPGTTKALYVTIAGRDQAALRILEKSGFELRSTFHVMECTLEAEPPALSPIANIDIREFVVGTDDDPVYEADEEAFLDEYGKEPRTFVQWARRLNMYEGFDASLWFVAWEGDQVAGAALNEVENGKGRIHHLGVRRPWRRRGLGMALLQHTMRAFYQRGIHTLILNVHSQSLTHANRLYERAGFKTVQEYHHYRKPL